MRTSHTLQTFAFAALLALIVFSGCKKDDCQPGEDCHDHENELITKVALTFSDPTTNQTISQFEFSDADGVGGNSPVIDSILLDSNKTYNVAVRIYAEHEDHTDEITAEILAEDDQHIFCFTPAGANLTVTRTDSDGTHEVGLKSSWVAGMSSSGTVTVVLRHQPDGTKDGSCTPGDTDFEAVFPALID